MESSNISTLCAIDGIDYGTLEELHKAVRWTHKMKQEDYYKTFFMRKDLFTGEDIQFKSLEYYLTNLWNDRRNMNAYLSKKSAAEIFDAVKWLLIQRKGVKGIDEAPTEIESKTIVFPAVSALVKKGIDYEKVCKEAGLKAKHPYGLGFGHFFNVYHKHEHTMVVDTREQNPLRLGTTDLISNKLDYGDYADMACQHKLAIERKSLNDFIGTLSRGYDRFAKECQRAKDDNAGLIVLVEAAFSKAQTFNYSGRNHSQCKPEYVFAQMRRIMREYPNVQFLFVDGRVEAARITKKIFAAIENPMNYDLQYLYDLKSL